MVSRTGTQNAIIHHNAQEPEKCLASGQRLESLTPLFKAREPTLAQLKPFTANDHQVQRDWTAGEPSGRLRNVSPDSSQPSLSRPGGYSQVPLVFKRKYEKKKKKEA